jgi:tetratricopeptide (TPR) repeat protein
MPLHRRLIFLSTLIAAFLFAQESRCQTDSAVTALLQCGYQALQQGPADAIPYFEEVVHRQPSNRLAQLQLGSIYLNLQRPRDAIIRFEIAHLIRPSDTTALQVAYLSIRLGDNLRAYEIFKSLQTSRDSAIAATARGAVAVMAPTICQLLSPWWMRPSATLYYDTRLQDLIFLGWYYVGYFLDDARKFSAYGVGSIYKDSRSSGGGLPVIYSDNYLLLGGGLRILPVRGMTIDIQPGVTYDLIERPGKNRVEADFRGTAAYGNGIYAPVETPMKATWPLHPFLDGYASVGYYSRYENTLLYSHGRGGVRAFAYGQTAVDAYLRLDFVADTQGEYYNNILEGGVGLRLIPDHRWGLSFIAEYHRGKYLKSLPAGSTLGSPYSTVRLFVVFDRFICW